VLLHAIVLLILALLIVRKPEESSRDPGIAGQLREDVTSLQPSDVSGDPFTRMSSVTTPSLPSTDEVNPLAINTPSLTPEVRLAPDLSLTPGESAGSGVPTNGAGAKTSRVGGTAAPFTGRRGPGKAQLLRREGGSVESEESVERGLDWIARHQRPDGAWSLDTNPMCELPGCPERRAMVADTGATGLALLPLLGAGHTHDEPGRYQQTVRRGLAWLVENQAPDGALWTGGGHPEGIYSHAIATLALGEAYAMTHDPWLRPTVTRAVKYLQRHANPAGGWRYEPQQPGDTSVLGWVLFALRSANLGEVAVSSRMIQGARRYLDTVKMDKHGSTYAYMPGWNVSMTMTAEGLVARQILGWPKDHPALNQGAAMVAAHLESDRTRNVYYWYYATMLLHNLGGKAWERWNEQVRDGLVATQIRGIGCDRGSWDPQWPEADVWGSKAGRLYTTSLSLLTLEVYYRYLPLYQDRGGALEGSEEEPVAAGP
jgi:hypothetical protein